VKATRRARGRETVTTKRRKKIRRTRREQAVDLKDA
jgi:hypothetical protein